MTNYAKRFAQGSIIVFVVMLASLVIGYVLRLFLLRNLSLQDFGLFYSILAFLGLFNLFKDFGFSTTLVKFISEFNSKNKKTEAKSAFITVLILELVISIIIIIPLFFLADYISISYFKTASASLPFKVMLISFVVSILFTIQNFFQGIGRIGHLSLVEFLRTVIVFIFVLTSVSFGVSGIAYSYLFGGIASAIILYILLFRVFPFFSTKTSLSFKLTKKIVFFSFPVFFTAIAGTILTSIDTITLTYFKSLEDVAVYQIALPTSQLLWAFAGAISIILLPMASELWALKQKKILSQGISILLKFTFIFIIPLAGILIAFPEIVINLLFGQAYLSAYLPLQLLAINAVFYSLFMILINVLVGIGKPQVNMKTMFLIAGLNLILNIIAVPYIGIVGAALTTTVSYFVGLVISLFHVRKFLDISVDFISFLKILGSGIFSILILYTLKEVLVLDNGWIELLISLPISIFIYLFSIVYFRIITKDDLQILYKTRVPIPNIFIRIVNRVIK